METVKDRDKREWHVGCGGEVVKSICIKCGERKRGLLSRLFGDEPIISREDPGREKRQEHRRRIRKGSDIFKE